jgi:hypothetical protein
LSTSLSLKSNSQTSETWRQQLNNNTPTSRLSGRELIFSASGTSFKLAADLGVGLTTSALHSAENSEQ